MADRRRRSPEGSRKGSRKDSKSQPGQYYEEPASGSHMRSRSPVRYSSSSSSSSSSSYLDISRTFPTHRSGLRAFFTAPSERRRLRKRRSKKFLRFNNSSSSSVNSDLAYGTGFIKKKKQRGVRSKKGKGIDRDSERERERYRERETQRERPGSGSGQRLTTEAEILAVGAGLAKLARDQNKLDLKTARNGKRPDLGQPRESGNSSYGASRGLGPSKVGHGQGSFDDDGWESASDGESDSSVDSKLAFSNESTVSFWPFGKKQHKPQSRKSSIVDPRLFGRQNSLNGVLTEPVGLHGDVTWTSTTNFGPQNFIPHEPGTGSFTGASATASQTSLRQVYPITTDDPYRVDAVRGRNGSSVVSGPVVYGASNRPEPVPIQHPKPFTPVSQSVFHDTPTYTARTESGSILKNTPSSSGKGKSIAEAALVGVAGAAIVSAISDRKDDRKDKRREEEREQDRIKRQEYEHDEERRRRRDSERKDSKDERRRERRESPDRSERKDKSKDKEKRKSDSKYSVEDSRPEKRKDETREEKDKRREKRREDRRSEAGDDRYESKRTKSETAVARTVVDPFQYQVERDYEYNPTQTAVSAPEHRRVGSVPTVVTVEREPNFGRQRSSSIKEGPSNYSSDPRSYSEYDDYKRQHKNDDSRDRPLEDGERNYQEIVHSTAPYSEAAIGAGVIAAAAEGYRESRSSKRRNERRGEKSSDYEDRDDTSRDKDRSKYEDSANNRSSAKDFNSAKERDPIQEEADRAYREIVMARKIASQVIRSRTPSPERSVVGKYDHKEAEEIIRIVTPPEMKENLHQKGPYDAPNADFRPDYVLTDPRELQNFKIPVQIQDRSDPYTGYLKRDPDADRPRPHLNLVHPTPAPTPIPEKQTARSEPEPSSEKSRESKRSAAPDVVIGPKGDIVASPTASNISKGVTWGKNETKHYEVDSPHEHKEEFVTKDEVKAHKNRDQPKSPGGTSKGIGWGAVAAAIGTGAGVTAEASSESSRSAKAKENDEVQNSPYEYRGVVVEPEDTKRSTRQPSPPSPGPKPTTKSIDQPYTSTSKPQSSHIPGAFDDDLDFTAHVAAGLQDTGFDPNIVINDPAFRRRDSPPGSNAPGFYRAPFSETVTDLGSVAPGSKREQSFVIGEVDQTPQEWRSGSPEGDESVFRLSKKDQKKRDKAVSKQNVDDFGIQGTSAREIVAEPEPWFEEPKLSKKEQKKRDKAARQASQDEEVTPLVSASDAQQFVEEPDSYFETPKKSKKKSKKGAPSYEEEAEEAIRNVIVPVHAFDDLHNGQDDWSESKESKKSKKKSKRDSELYDSPSQSAAPSEVGTELERTSSKKSKDKSKRRGEGYEPSPSEVSLPPSTPSETSRDGEHSDLRSSRRSNKDSGIVPSVERDDSRSVVSSRYDEDEPRRKKKSRSSNKDDFDDTTSVASAPVGDDEDRKQKKDKKSGGFFGLFGSKSEVGARDNSPKGSKDDFEDIKKKSKKEKRRSMPDAGSPHGNFGSQSINDLSRTVSNGQSNGSHNYEDVPDLEARSDGEKKKTRSRAESTSSRKDSFLGNAGTLGAGVGIAGAAVAIAAQHHRQSKAANDNSSQAIEHENVSRSETALEMDDVFDPEIIPRQIRPAIDPQYGDLLPLPPSGPASPSLESLEGLPDLPESRPESPEAGRPSKLTVTPLRRNLIEPPMKSPSHSAVPLKFMMGNRSTPSSPGLIRSPQAPSPEYQQQETLSFPRSRPTRPTSWDSTREYKPLYLVESNRRLSNARVEDDDENLPELPPSQRTSRSSSQHEHLSSNEKFAPTFADDSKSPNLPLSIDTALASSHSGDLLDSQQSTPRAGTVLREALHSSASLEPAASSRSPPVPAYRISQPSSPTVMEKSRAIDDLIPAAAAAAPGLVSTIGYFASSPRRPMAKENWMDDLPSVQRRPSPVDSMTKNRSSYLLNSSPMSRKFDSEDTATRDLPSPTMQGNLLHSTGDTLHKIEERDGSDIFGAGTTEQVTEADGVAGTSKIEDELPEEFTFSKSKKDKKKDKKKGKALSRSSTQDDVTYSAPSIVADLESSFTTESGTAEDFDLPKSKKDKKKDKKKNKLPLNWEETAEETTEQPQAQQTSLELSREVSEESPAVDHINTTEEFASLKPKKDKKGDKKRAKSAKVWDGPAGDEPLVQQVQDSVPESAKDGSSSAYTAFDTDPVNEFFLPNSKSKKEKKNKKKSQVLDDIPIESEQPIVTAEELTADEFHDAPEGYLTPVDTTPFETPFEEFSTPQSHYGASSSREAFNWESNEVNSSEGPPAIASWDVLTTPAQITSKEADPFEEFSAPKMKKDKKKSKATQALAFLGDDNLIASHDNFSVIHNLPEMLVQPPISTVRNIFEGAMTPPVAKEEQTDEAPLQKHALMSAEVSGIPQNPPEPVVNIIEPPIDEKTTPLEVDAEDEFALPKSKKEKKKKAKPFLAKEVELVKESEHESSREATGDGQPSMAPTSEVGGEYFTPKSKKDKTKDKKKAKSLAWEDNVPEISISESVIEPVQSHVEERSAAVDDPTFTRSSRSKQNEENPALSAVNEEAATIPTPEFFEPHRETTQDNLQDAAVEDFGFVESKKGKKKKNKNKSSSLWSDDQETMPHSEVQQQDISEVGVSGSIKDMEISNKDQLEVVDPLILPPQMPVSSTNQGFLATAGIAAAAGVGMASFNDASQSSKGDQETKDGFDAGYTNDQLSLARQMQEEFAAKSSKKSKKDKKKRQSLPSTPDLETPRSRAAEDSTSEQQRARSLSIGPSADRSADSPSTDLRKSLYREDQLELARQLKQEFDGGSTKSRKDKKKSQWASTEDDASFDLPAVEIPTMDTSIGSPLEGRNFSTSQEPVKRDGFEAGYQEDQLSLARQLQAEFGKKSKKDKKRRSTSQTPLDQESPNDYFGETSHYTASDPSQIENIASNIDSPAADSGSTRDGLAVGYNEDQLELARQLKEEFSSGSKKSKKDKKGKNRESLLRSTTDDDFYSDAQSGTVEGSESVTPNAEDEFAPVSTKSKKDKKAKKRESLLRGNTDNNDSAPPVPISEEIALQAPETTQIDSAEALEDIPTVEPENEFGPISKKSKQDKKGKKRVSTLPSPVEENVTIDTTPLEGEQSKELDILHTELANFDTPSMQVIADEDFSLSAKKSKKDKKNNKRNSVILSADDGKPAEPFVAKSTLTQPDIVEAEEPGQIEPVTVEPEVEFSLRSKKAKKDKKGKNRENSLQLTPDNFGDAVEALHKPQDSETKEVDIGAIEAATPADDDWTSFSMSKKSKKDIKKRNQSVVAEDGFVAENDKLGVGVFAQSQDSQPRELDTVPIEAVAPFEDNWTSYSIAPNLEVNKKDLPSITPLDESFYQQEPEVTPVGSTEIPEPSTAKVIPARAVAEDENDNSEVFEFTTRKSKKDKKKRASLLQSSTFEEDQEQKPETEIVEPISDPVNLNPEVVGPPPEVVAEDDRFEISGKKSKKDKKKRKSIQQAADFDDAAKDLEEPVTVQPESQSLEVEIPTSETTIPPHTIRSEPERNLTAGSLQDTPEASFDDFAFPTKKSKKDKKKNKGSHSGSAEASGLSTPLDLILESDEVSKPVSITDDIVETAVATDDLAQVTGAPFLPPVPEQQVDDLYSAQLQQSDEAESIIFKDPRSDKLVKPRNKFDDPNVSTETKLSSLEDPSELLAEPFQEPQIFESNNAPALLTETVREPQASKLEIAPRFSTKTVREPETSTVNNVILSVEPARELDIPTIDTAPELALKAVPEPESSTTEATPESSTEPTQEEGDAWGMFSTKKTKKDKKKKKSGHSTPAEELSVPESDKEMADSLHVPSEGFPTSELTPQAATGPDDGWANFPLKKSKKEKKNAKKSGLSTPLDEDSETKFDIAVEPNETTAAQAVRLEVGPTAMDEAADDGWTASFPAKKSKKEKNKAKSTNSTPTEDIPVITEPSIIEADFSQQPEPEDEWGIFTKTSKRNKKDGNKSSVSTPIGEASDVATPEESFDPEPFKQRVEGPIIQEVVQEAPAEDELSNSSVKVSKKDKKKNKKSGITTPVNELSETLPVETSVDLGQISDRRIEDSAIPEVVQDVQAQDEWSVSPAKLLKKEKKKNKKSGSSTPADGIPTAEATDRSVASRQPPEGVVEEQVIPIEKADTDDEWSAFPTSLSKNDEKEIGESGLSALGEETLTPSTEEEPVGSVERGLVQAAEPSLSGADVDDEWTPGAFSAKKSKKDKKKQRRSGLSTPLDVEILDPNTEQTREDFHVSATQPIPIHDDLSQSHIVDETTEESSKVQKAADTPAASDEFDAVPKLSKKDKKKQKLGSSAPFEELTSVTPKVLMPESNKSDLLPVDNQEVETEERPSESTLPEPDFEFTLKKSKKEKKGKRSSKVELESVPTTSTVISSIANMAAAADDNKPLEAVRQSTNTALLEQETNVSSKHTLEPEIATEPGAAVMKDQNETDGFVFELSRKSSKTDKRKRQPTLDFSTQDDSSSSKPPFTSWADEIEEAEVERQAPVIEEIAEDESLSHIASTTEAFAIDDFSRPSKKGKKGKKRQSAEPDFVTEAPPPVGDDIQQLEQTNERSGLSVLGVSGAALVGAAVIGAAKGTSGNSMEKERSTDVKETPSRRQSKKDKKKKGIDRRSAPEDDIFDDPSLWEGAEPKAHEEVKDRLMDDDTGDDGFWSPPQEEQPMDTATNDQAEMRSGLSFGREDVSSGPVQYDPNEEKHRLPTPEVTMPSVLIDDQYISPPRRLSPPLAMEPSRDKVVALDSEPQKIDQSFSTPTRAERIIADTPDERSPFGPLSGSKFALSGFSGLPAVEEEGPAQSEAENSGSLQSHDRSYNRDSAFVSGSPIPTQRALFPDAHEHIRDSGVHFRDVSPLAKSRGALSSSDDAIARLSWPSVDEDTETVDLDKSQRDSAASSKKHSQDPSKYHDAAITGRSHFSSQRAQDEKLTDLQTGHKSPSLVRQRVQRIESPDFQHAEKPQTHGLADLISSRKPKAERYQELSLSQIPKPDKPRGIDESFPAAIDLGAATPGFAAARQASLEKRPESAQSQRSTSNVNRLRTPDPRYRPDSVASNRSGTPPLRRTDRKISGDLRSLSQLSKPNLAKEAELAAIAASIVNTANPTANEGRVRAKDMADVYDGFGEGRMGSPRSPTRPHSMRRRQSMQVLELESKLDQLAAENRMLSEAHAQAERGLQSSRQTSSSLVEKDAEIDALKRTLEWLQTEVTRLTEVNDGLTSANVTLGNQHNHSYGALESQHAQATRELHEVRESHNTLTTGMQGIVAAQIQNATEEKDREITQLRASLDAAKEQIREMQRQILAVKANDSEFLTIRDEDYFDNACQQLCQHVQQWVLRFSKFSDMRACRLTSEVNNDKTIDRLDNAILDGSDVDTYLTDRIKRRDVFMSMTMTMVWEFVFTRYLFGMDREQRQKLKSLEKLLSEVGPASAVHQWRATTLTLLAKREAFIQQREQDTQAVVHAIMETLSEILPPPSHLEAQIEEQLERVMKAAVDLSIEMRTQRAEYMMLPPLQPEYDANGDLASKVQFNAALMNERSGDTASNEDLEAQKAVVRIVLFPLVVKKGDDKGEGDEEIVVCPAQVLVAKPKKQVRVFSPGSAAGASRVSMQSTMPADYGEGGVI